MTRTPKPKIILLIEDNAYVSQSYTYFLKAGGYEVDIAENALEARKRLKDRTPDLIMLDLIMPGINGFDFLAEIKKKPKTKGVPVIVISNLCQEGDVERCRKLGAADYLIKSNFYMRDVLDRIKVFLAAKEA
ncbi:MAG: hypothetical protein RJB39_561 [Candidatus Parcubacteria bacterium]|jgi:DNA-binding response OmpR family regulator